MLCLCFAGVCFASDIDATELAIDIEQYITERIVPIVVGVLTSLVALITVLRKIFGALKSLNDTKDTFVEEAKERASAFRSNTELLENKAQEIKKTVEGVPTIEEQMTQLKGDMSALIDECNVLAKILSLGFSANSEVIKSGKGKQMAQLLENAKCKMQNTELTTLPSPRGDTSPCTGEAKEGKQQ